jgi:hypothetical protein
VNREERTDLNKDSLWSEERSQNLKSPRIVREESAHRGGNDEIEFRLQASSLLHHPFREEP